MRNDMGKTLMNKQRSKNLRRPRNIDNINDWLLGREKEWNNHIERIGDGKIVRVARDKPPNGRRYTGKPRRRRSVVLLIYFGISLLIASNTNKIFSLQRH